MAESDRSTAGTSEIVFSAEYQALRRQLFGVNVVANVLVLLTIYFMTAQTGA